MEEEFQLGGLEEVTGGLSDIGGDASMRARDAANMAGSDMMTMGFGDEPQSLADVATQGMGEGLSAMKEGLGTESGGIELNAALADEEEDEPIRAALEDEEEETPIRAGRMDDEPVKAGYGSSSGSRSSGAPLSMSKGGGSSYNPYDNNLANDPSQNIDGIFIAGSFNRGSGPSGGVSSTGGTMYDPSKDKPDVNVSFGLPSFVKKILGFIVFVVVVLGIMKYGFHINVENFYHPVDVQADLNASSADLATKYGLKFKSVSEKYTSSDFEYSLDIEKAGGLRLVNYDKKRFYIEVQGTRIDYAIYGVRPQISKYTDIIPELAAKGFIEEEAYSNIEELGSKGMEHVFVNKRTGEGIIVGKKENYQSVKSVKYVGNYKKFKKVWDDIRNNAG